MVTAALIFVVPLALLAAAAVLVGIVLFVTLGLTAKIMLAVRDLFTGASSNFRGDGRRNVRVRHDH